MPPIPNLAPWQERAERVDWLNALRWMCADKPGSRDAQVKSFVDEMLVLKMQSWRRPESNRDTFLHACARQSGGIPEEVWTRVAQGMIEWKVDLNAKNLAGRSALHVAALGDHADFIQALASLGASLEIVDASGDTPLCDAVVSGSVAAFDALLAAGASTAPLDKHGKRLWEMAMERGRLGMAARVLAHVEKSELSSASPVAAQGEEAAPNARPRL